MGVVSTSIPFLPALPLHVRPRTFIAGMSTVTSFPAASDFRGTLKGVAEESEFQALFLGL